MINVQKRYMDRPMKILIACEESQTVCAAMRERGHEAYSADLQEPSGGHPEWHILGDVLPLINGNCIFRTMDCRLHKITGKWDLLIAHPPCTYLTSAGACRLVSKGKLNQDRLKKGLAAKDFFLRLYYADCERICIENPSPLKCYSLPQYTQIVQPYMFGEKYTKRTCLWLIGLPPLVPTNDVGKPATVISHMRDNGKPYYKCWTQQIHGSKVRSKTFSGIAYAMAEQWTSTQKPEPNSLQITLFDKYV